jgi:hypothetical protein
MKPLKLRSSAIGRIMTEPKTLKEGPLSVGAKTYLRQLAAQDILGIEFEISGKEMEKGILVEDDAIATVGRVRGLELSKNKERREDEYFTGECDVFHAPSREGRDTKCSWSAATFPISVVDCEDKVYEFQMRTYMRLWDSPRWHVDYVLLDTPSDLIRYEPVAMHIVSHIPEHLRVTTWTVDRDLEIEARMVEKVKAARLYYAEVVAEFDRTHRSPDELKSLLRLQAESRLAEAMKAPA